MVNSPSATEALEPAAARPRVEGDGAPKVALRLEALWKTYPGSLQPAWKSPTRETSSLAIGPLS